MNTVKAFNFRKDQFWSFQRSLWNVILTSRNSKIGKPLLLIISLLEVIITFKRLPWNDQNWSFRKLKALTVNIIYLGMIVYNWWLSMRWIQGLINPWNMIFTEASEQKSGFSSSIFRPYEGDITFRTPAKIYFEPRGWYRKYSRPHNHF